MAVATYQDVAVALGRSIDSAEEQGQVDWWLNGIEVIIGARLGDVSELDQGVLRYVEVEAAAARVRRGDSRISSETISVDDGSYTKRFADSASTSDMTDEWWNLLNPTIASGAYSTRPTFEADTVRWAVSTPPATPTVWSDFP
jgi:hypothetical protein